jgi:DNA-binding response OmpR family regulator
VLVVEDSRPLADDHAEGRQDEGIAVDVADDGLQAATRSGSLSREIFKLELHTDDGVALDRDLPGLRGDTVCRIITERDHRAIVLMPTASGSPAQRVSGLRLGTDRYFPTVWDENVDPLTNTVHVTISRLRRQLEDPPAFETIPNVGYRITQRW